MAKLPRILVDEFCCGCTLHTGAYISAVLSVLYALLLAGAPWTMGVCGHQLCKKFDGGLATQLAFWVSAALLVLFSLLLIIGTKLGRRELLLPWLTFSVLYVTLWLLLGCAGFIFLSVHGAFLLATATFFVCLNMSVVPVYFIVAVASLFFQMKGASMYSSQNTSIATT